MNQRRRHSECVQAAIERLKDEGFRSWEVRRSHWHLIAKQPRFISTKHVRIVRNRWPNRKLLKKMTAEARAFVGHLWTHFEVWRFDDDKAEPDVMTLEKRRKGALP